VVGSFADYCKFDPYFVSYIILSDPYCNNDGDSGEEDASGLQPMTIDIDLDLNAHANARK
jgi:hypothetical protein